jgi:hypothetical protein
MYHGQLPEGYGVSESAALVEEGVLSLTPIDRGDGTPLYLQEGGQVSEVFSPQTPVGINYPYMATPDEIPAPQPGTMSQQVMEAGFGGDGKLSEIFSNLRGKVGQGQLQALLGKFKAARRVQMKNGSVVRQNPNGALLIESTNEAWPVGTEITNSGGYQWLWQTITKEIGVYRRPLVGAAQSAAQSPQGQAAVAGLLSRFGIGQAGSTALQTEFIPSGQSAPVVMEAPPKDNTKLYIGLGLGAVVLFGLYAATRD